eukprot:15066598-Alexandrium_andersonii.AAC.1
MFGLRGTKLLVSKNIARYQREEGEWARFLMALLSKVAPGIEYSHKHWEFDAVEVRDQWAGAIATSPQNSRRKVILYNPELFSGKDVGLAAKELWR